MSLLEIFDTSSTEDIEVKIIEGLFEKGAKYFDESFSKIKSYSKVDSEIITLLQDHHKIYLEDTEIYGDSKSETFNYILKTGTKYWESLKNPEEFLLELFNSDIFCNDESHLENLNNILESETCKNLLKNPDIWVKSTFDQYKNSFLGKIYKFEYKKIIHILKNLDKNYYLNYINFCINILKLGEKFSENNYQFMTNITLSLSELLKNYEKTETFTFLNDSKCLILFNDKYDNPYDFYSKYEVYFTTLIYAITKTFIRVSHDLQSLANKLKSLKSELDVYGNGLVQLFNFFDLDILQKKYDDLEVIKKDKIKFISDNYPNPIINDFVKVFDELAFIISETEFETNTKTDEFMSYFQNMIVFCNIDIKDKSGFSKFILQMISTDKLTKNIHLRKIFINFISKLSDEFITDGIYGLIKLFNFVEKKIEDTDLIEMRMNIISAFNLNISRIDSCIINISNDKNRYIDMLKFISCIFNDYNFILEKYDMNYKKIIDSPPIFRSGYIYNFNIFYDTLIDYLEFIEMLNINDLISYPQVSNHVSSTLLLTLNICKKIKTENQNILSNIKFNLDKLYYLTYKFIEKYCAKKDFLYSIVKDPIYFNIDMFRELPSLIKDYKIENIDILINNLETAKKINKDEIDYDIPDELLDPILQTLIEEPVYLPNSEIVLDKDTILKHLLHNETNPFTREPLTIEMLEDYNSKPEIKKLIDSIKQQISKYKN
tara:strand:- start:531 stop:2681 length:2151 start_codon:yes stop_codon:yes gene_type:complete